MELQQVHWRMSKNVFFFFFCFYRSPLCHHNIHQSPVGCLDFISAHFSKFAFYAGLWLSHDAVQSHSPLLSHIISFPICANAYEREFFWLERMAGLFLVWWAWWGYKAAASTQWVGMSENEQQQNNCDWILIREKRQPRWTKAKQYKATKDCPLRSQTCKRRFNLFGVHLFSLLIVLITSWELFYHASAFAPAYPQVISTIVKWNEIVSGFSLCYPLSSLCLLFSIHVILLPVSSFSPPFLRSHTSDHLILRSSWGSPYQTGLCCHKKWTLRTDALRYERLRPLMPR